MKAIQAALAKKIKKAPETPGVYVFKNQTKEVLYIGKAIHLRKRLLYYTKDTKDLMPKTARFLEKAASVEWIEVSNEFEAILLEMNLIRTLKPHYNILSKDDKRPLLIHITKDELPRVKKARVDIPHEGDFFGPFPSSYKLKLMMRQIRRIFPYCTCNASRKHACLFADLGLCQPSPPENLNIIQKKVYLQNIRRLKLFLRGKIKTVLKQLTKQMSTYAQQEAYEEAHLIKEQIDRIQLLLTPDFRIGGYFEHEAIQADLKVKQLHFLAQILNIPKPYRIEGYDIANTSGKQPTGSMVVFEGGFPNTSEYRRFKIENIIGPNDPLMMYHVLSRRLKHRDWPLPQLILIDGGKTQVKAAQKALIEAQLDIPFLGLAKRMEELVVVKDQTFNTLRLPLDHPALILLRAVRDEAHRFTTTYHKFLRQKKMLEK